MTDAELQAFLAALDQATREFESDGVSWSRLIHASAGHTVIAYDGGTQAHRDIVTAVGKAAEAVVQEANATAMAGWGMRRVNELGNALEDRFQTALNSLGLPLRCAGFSQATGYPDRRILSDGQVVAYVDLKTYERTSESSRFRSFYHQPRQARSKITTDGLHLLLGFPHDENQGTASQPYWPLDGYSIIDLSSLKVKLKGEFQASNYDLYVILQKIQVP
jgi:hypothetical protein